MSTPRTSPGTVAAGVGLLLALALVAASILLPKWLDIDTVTRRDDFEQWPPLHGYWWVHTGGLATVAAVLLALLAVAGAGPLARRLPWHALLAGSFVVSLGWLLALALVDPDTEFGNGLTRVLGNDYEYLQTAREINDIPQMLSTYVDRIPIDSTDNWVTHIAGHPPGALLFFVGLVRVGLGGDLAAALVVTVLAATIPAAVLITLRRLGAEDSARLVAPFLVFTPAAVFMAVSADAMFAAVTSWGLAALACATTCTGSGQGRGGGRGPSPALIGWSVAAGLLLGYGVLLSYGLPLIGLVALAVLWCGRSWWPLLFASAAALGLVLVFAALGFSWWEAYPVLRERYYEGIATDRPLSYWIWGNLGALLICAGPALGAGLGATTSSLVRRVRGASGDSPQRHAGFRGVKSCVALRSIPAGVLALAAVGCIAAADLSGMSKSEVERIWLPFVPWLTLALVALPPRWRRPMLAVQVVTALLVQHLLYTSW